jgi:hypothetical protein
MFRRRLAFVGALPGVACRFDDATQCHRTWATWQAVQRYLPGHGVNGAPCRRCASRDRRRLARASVATRTPSRGRSSILWRRPGYCPTPSEHGGTLRRVALPWREVGSVAAAAGAGAAWLAARTSREAVDRQHRPFVAPDSVEFIDTADGRPWFDVTARGHGTRLLLFVQSDSTACTTARYERGSGERQLWSTATTKTPAAAGTNPTKAKPGPSATIPPARGPSR